MAKGVLKWFDENKNYGFILDEHNKEVFVHRRNIPNAEWQNLLEGDDVVFEYIETKKGIQAAEVKKVGGEASGFHANSGKRYISKLIRTRVPVILKMCGGRTAVGILTRDKIYDFDLEIDGNETIEVRKLDVKYIFKKDVQSKISQLIDLDPEVKADKKRPSEKITERFVISNQAIANACKQRKEMSVTLNEGEQFKGEINWFTKYEVLLRVHKLVSVLIFRHAIVDVAFKTRPQSASRDARSGQGRRPPYGGGPNRSGGYRSSGQRFSQFGGGRQGGYNRGLTAYYSEDSSQNLNGLGRSISSLYRPGPGVRNDSRRLERAPQGNRGKRRIVRPGEDSGGNREK